MSKIDFEKHILTGIDDYAVRARQSIPGRDAFFAIARCYFENQLIKNKLPENKLSTNAKILVVGAGGGEEIISLGKHNPGWRFVGVDLSEKMLQLANSRVQQENLKNDIQLHKMEVLNLEDKNFDAATCFLTLHFIPDDGSKLATLQAIQKRLKPNSPFMLVDGAGERETVEFNDNFMAWKTHAQNNGISSEFLEQMTKTVMELPFVSEDREIQLLAEAGFEQIRKVYQGIWFNGWLAIVN